MTSQHNKEKEMDKKRKGAADKIIDGMVVDGASQQDINTQKKANKKHFGHEGEADI
ncbi:hypothetical protein [Methanococcoides methylutens]|uniref:hypothetical protein n=1 Tax=Methanococcoides methylutens TaxID=2226 RepID=UPI0013637578|nr:hypothetical protein [Methanococcoides methylutens]